MRTSATNFCISWGRWSTSLSKAVEQYAKAICDSIEKYGYDIIDIDYERNFFLLLNKEIIVEIGLPLGRKIRALISCNQDSNKKL